MVFCVRALKRVDLPTFGRPTSPTLTFILKDEDDFKEEVTRRFLGMKLRPSHIVVCMAIKSSCRKMRLHVLNVTMVVNVMRALSEG